MNDFASRSRRDAITTQTHPPDLLLMTPRVLKKPSGSDVTLGTVRKAVTEVLLLLSVRFRRVLGNWTVGWAEESDVLPVIRTESSKSQMLP